LSSDQRLCGSEREGGYPFVIRHARILRERGYELPIEAAPNANKIFPER